MTRPIRVGLVGVGHMGRHHLACLLRHPLAQVQALYEPHPATQAKLHSEGLPVVPSYEEVLKRCEAVFIASPTPTHYTYAAQALRAQKHVFIEKPVVTHPEELEDLLRLAEEAGTTTMVGHIERFNPILVSTRHWAVETTLAHFRRVAPFTLRGSEVSVALDLLIHDLDLIWFLWRKVPAHLHAVGLRTVTSDLDTLQVWLEFVGGAAATFLISRDAGWRERKALFWGPTHTLEVDFIERKGTLWTASGPQLVTPTHASDALYAEVDQFLQAIQAGKPSTIPIEDVQPVMEWTWRVEELARHSLYSNSH